MTNLWGYVCGHVGKLIALQVCVLCKLLIEMLWV